MDYFLVCWNGSSVSGDMHEIQSVVLAASAKQAVLESLINLGCLNHTSSLHDLNKGSISLTTNNTVNDFSYTPHRTSEGINAVKLILVDVEMDDETITVLLPKNKNERTKTTWDKVSNPFLATIKWSSFGFNHNVESRNYLKVLAHGQNLHSAATNVMTAIAMDADPSIDHHRAESALDKSGYYYSNENSTYELVQIEVMQKSEVVLDGDVINIAFSKSHSANGIPPIAWVLFD